MGPGPQVHVRATGSEGDRKGLPPGEGPSLGEPAHPLAAALSDRSMETALWCALASVLYVDRKLDNPGRYPSRMSSDYLRVVFR